LVNAYALCLPRQCRWLDTRMRFFYQTLGILPMPRLAISYCLGMIKTPRLDIMHRLLQNA